MSISLSLHAAARSAYRSLFRSASVTFSGDERVLNAFLDKTRSAYREGRSISDEKRYEESIALAREVAMILRTNIVQARKASQEDVWKLNITEDTELGDNTSIKGSPQISESQVHTTQRMNFSELKRLRQKRDVPQLNESDLEESFVRGSGPGGQSVNKTENCVQLLHKPTSLRVSCQETRSLDLNRRIARKILLEKLDQQQNPGLSRGDMRRARMNERERQKRKKRRKKENLDQLSQDEKS